jgi:serine/threonine protein kinase
MPERVEPDPARTRTLIAAASIAGTEHDRLVTLTLLADVGTPAMSPPPGSLPLPEGAEESAAGRYVVRGVVGRGGMGEVIACLDRDTRRQVAMKRMLPGGADDPMRCARFVEEAQVTAQLEHPNIVPVHELARDAQGNLYYTMKLVKGRSLSAILKAVKGGDESVSLGEVFLKACDAVGFAHSRGVIHRDLKPDNIMVGDFGEVLVMDWGLAKILGREDLRAGELVTSDRLESGREMTMDGSTVGAPAYMPPEQAKGEIDKIDHRSDIYSLGAILYEILTLERPLEAPTALAMLVKVMKGQILPPERRAPNRQIPRELSAVAMKCLAKNRASRYRSVVQLRQDVSLFLEGRSVSASPDTFAQAAVKLVKRNKGVSAAVAAAAAGTPPGPRPAAPPCSPSCRGAAAGGPPHTAPAAGR